MTALAKRGSSAKEKKDKKYAGCQVITAQADVLGGFSNGLSSVVAFIASFADDDSSVKNDLSQLRCNTAKTIQAWNGRSLVRAAGLITSTTTPKLVIAQAAQDDQCHENHVDTDTDAKNTHTDEKNTDEQQTALEYTPFRVYILAKWVAAQAPILAGVRHLMCFFSKFGNICEYKFSVTRLSRRI